MGEDEEKVTANEVESAEAKADEVAFLKKALDEEKEKAQANLDGWKRAQADFANYKRRVEQERAETSRFANAGLVCNILPVLDDMERAFQLIPAHLKDEPWIEGLKMVERKLRSCLENEGLCQINATGECFDPHLHEAVRQDKGKGGVVLEELQKGYQFKDKVIRPAKVVVGSGEDENQEVPDEIERKED